MSNTMILHDVMDFQIEVYSATTTRGEILHKVDYAKDAVIRVSGSRDPIRGGSGNYKIADVDHTKDCIFATTLPLFDIKLIQTKLGKTVTTGATAAPINEVKTASATNTITLSQTPLANTLKVYLLPNAASRDMGVEQTAGTPASAANTYSISGTTITLNATSAPAGTRVYVTYSYTSGATANRMKITANTFPTNIRITGRAWTTDDVTMKEIPVSFDVYKCKPKIDFEMMMGAGQNSEFSYECDCSAIRDSDNDLTYINIVKLNDEAV